MNSQLRHKLMQSLKKMLNKNNRPKRKHKKFKNLRRRLQSKKKSQLLKRQKKLNLKKKRWTFLLGMNQKKSKPSRQ